MKKAYSEDSTEEYWDYVAFDKELKYIGNILKTLHYPNWFISNTKMFRKYTPIVNIKKKEMKPNIMPQAHQQI